MKLSIYSTRTAMLCLLITTLFLMTPITYAFHIDEHGEQTKELEPPKNFTGNIQIGAMVTTGDTEEYTQNGAFNFKYLHDKMSYTGLVSVLYDYNRTENDHNERYQGQSQANYNFTKRNYYFVNTNFVADSADGYEYIWESQTGYGRRLFNSERYHMTLDAQAGPGYRIAPSDDDEIKDNQETLNGSVIYNWDITRATSLGQTISSSYAENDTITNAKTTVSTKIYKSLGVQLAMNLTHHTAAADGSKKTNTISTINLIYGF